MSRAPKVYATTCPECGQHILRQRDTCTVGEAARALDVAQATIRNWGRSGKLPMYRTLGGHRRILREDIERLATSMQKPEPTIAILP